LSVVSAYVATSLPANIVLSTARGAATAVAVFAGTAVQPNETSSGTTRAVVHAATAGIAIPIRRTIENVLTATVGTRRRGRLAVIASHDIAESGGSTT